MDEIVIEVLRWPVAIAIAVIAVILAIELFILSNGTSCSGMVEIRDRGWRLTFVQMPGLGRGWRDNDEIVIHAYINQKYLILRPIAVYLAFSSRYHNKQTVKIKYSTAFPKTCVIDDKFNKYYRYILLGVLMLAAVWLCLMIVRQ